MAAECSSDVRAASGMGKMSSGGGDGGEVGVAGDHGVQDRPVER
jgi:hypothetical protein